MMRQRSWVFASVALVVATWFVLLMVQDAAAGARPQHTVRAAVALVKAVNGLDDRLELLEDARIRPEFRSLLWGSDEAMYCYQGGGDALRPFCASLTVAPLRRALVRVVTRAGREVVAQELERELGELTTVRLYGDTRPTYAVTVDLSVGFGSYAGPLTRLAEIRDSRLVWLRAVDQRTQEVTEIQLIATLKTAWQFAPHADGSGQDIWLVSCRPVLSEKAATEAESPFTITFVRYSFDGKAWRRSARSEPGFWENGSPFPSPAAFP